MSMRIKRVYAPFDPADGYRILVDRLWPRGLSLERAGVDEWLREVAPSTALRRWFGHDPAYWPEFRHRYFDELRSEAAATAIEHHLRALSARQRVPLLYAAQDEAHNNAVALTEYLAAAHHGRT